MRLRRTIFWAKAIKPDVVKQAIESNVDALCFDLEDGVIANLKDQARAATVDMLKNWDCRGKERIVRINKFHTPEQKADLEAILPCKPDALRIPKCENVEDLLWLDQLLRDFENANGMEENSIEMILMIETALGMLRVYELASCCKRITAVGIGMEDFTTSMGIKRIYELGNTDLLYARQRMVLACKAANVQAIDSGTLFKGNPEYMRQDTIIDKRQGFDGRSVGDLAQVDVVNEVFSPSKEDVEWAHRVITAYAEGMAAGENYIHVDGFTIDPPVIFKAERILEQQKQIEAHAKKTACGG